MPVRDRSRITTLVQRALGLVVDDRRALRFSPMARVSDRRRSCPAVRWPEQQYRPVRLRSHCAGNAVELCRSRFLRKRQSGLFLDGPQAKGAVRAHAGKDHPDAVTLLVVGQRTQKEIDRQAQAAPGCGLQQVQPRRAGSTCPGWEG